MAARKTTTKKSTKSAPKGKRAAQPQPEELGPILSRPVWGAIWGIVGLLCLLSILPIDGVLLKWLHRGIGALIGKGAYVMPFALIGIAVLLFARPKGPVRLRGTCIALMPLLIGSIIHAFSCANEYDLSMSTLSGLLSTGMEGSSGGLLGGGLYILLEWALSSIGALLILLVLFIVSLLVACRITPQALYDMVRPPEYEYEDEEERERYEAPLQLPNIHEAAAAHAQRREERRAHRKSDFDIPIDTDPPGEDKPGEELIDPRKRKGKAIAPDEYLRSLRDNVKKKAGSIMNLVENKQPEEESAHVSEPEPEHEAAPAPASKSKKTENISETEQEAMNIAIDESQKAPMPVYDYPPIDLLTQGKHASVAGAEAELRESSACLLDTLDSFNIEAQIIGIVRGPSVTRFELTIPRGIKISRITALSDDIALSLGAANVRIAPIPDKVAVGIEVPNKTVNTVFIRECIGSPAFANAKSRLSFAVGKDITGKPVIGDIAKMPHMLIAGTTGSGKSVCINSMLISLLYKSTPEEVRLIMVDPKMVELGIYNGIPHLLIPVVSLGVAYAVIRFGLDKATNKSSVFVNGAATIGLGFVVLLLAMPLVLVALLAGVVGVLWGIGVGIFRGCRCGIWPAGAGTVLTVLALLLTAGYNHTAYYPSLTDLQSSLTIYNSSSSRFTLYVMAIVSILVPFVAGYIWYVWRAMGRKRISEQELQEEGDHLY